MRTLFLPLVFLGIFGQSVIAQNYPYDYSYPDDSPEQRIYKMYLSCYGEECARHLPEVARLFDERIRPTMALKLFYFYFISVAYYSEKKQDEAAYFARQCKSLLAEYEEKKMLFWDQEEARYMRGMNKMDVQRIKDWILFILESKSAKDNTGNYFPAFPQFPFPPPQSSTKQVLDRDIFQKCNNLSEVSQVISYALDRCDYEKSYYSIPNGFALVARLEQMNKEDASSLREPDRWSASLPPLRDFSDYFKALFFPQEGHYRIVAFLVTDQPFYEQNRVVSHEEAIGWLKSGLNVLPDVIGKLKWTEAYQCTALIYEFKVTSANQKGELISSKFSALTHLQRSRLMLELRIGRR